MATNTTTSTDGYTLLKSINLPGGVGGHGDWVTYDPTNGYVWLAQSPDHNAVAINTATNTIQGVVPGIANGNGIAITPNYAFVADAGNNVVDVVNKNTFQKAGVVTPTGTTPDGTTYVSSTDQVFVASDDANVEDAINATAPFAQASSLQLLPNPSASGPDVSTYVPSKDLLYQPDQGQIDVIDPHTNSIVNVWTLPQGSGTAKPVVYDPTTNHFLVGTTADEMLVLDGTTGSVVDTIPISGSVDETAIDVGARLAFVGDKAGVVDVINLDTDQLVGDLPAEKNMHTLTVDPTTHDVYVYENDSNRVDVFAPASSITSTGTTTGTVTNGTLSLPNVVSQDAIVKSNNGAVTVTVNNQTIDGDSANQIAFLDGILDLGASSPAAQVVRLYNAAFGRNPDVGGLNYWTSVLQSGTSATTVAQDLLSSPEGHARFSGSAQSGAGFINQIYENAFHRPADQAGSAFWTQQLANGQSQAQVLTEIANTPEAQSDTASQIKSGVWLQNTNAAAVEGLYYTALNRAPDSAGLAFWTKALSTGTSLQAEAQDFVNSPEFASLYGSLTPTQFVTSLYENVLGRAPDSGGLDYWTNALNSGAATKASTVLYFSQSPERLAMHIGTQGVGVTPTVNATFPTPV